MLSLTARAKCPWCGEVVFKQVGNCIETVTFRCHNEDVDSISRRVAHTGCGKYFTALVVPRVKVQEIQKKEG